MNEQLKFLIELQEIDKVIDYLKREQERLPSEIEKIKSSIEEEKGRIDELKKTLTQLQVERKNQEIELDIKEQAIRKHLTELNLVKTNEAYRALLSEIEKSKEEKNLIEDKILGMMQKTEDLSLEIKRNTENFEKKREENEKEIKISEEEINKLTQGIEEKEKVRENIVSLLSPPLYARYTKVRENKGGLAVVPVENNYCGGCRMLLPPHLVNEVHKDQTIINCEVCSRILYRPALVNK